MGYLAASFDLQPRGGQKDGRDFSLKKKNCKIRGQMGCYLQCSSFLKSLLRFLGPRTCTYLSILKKRYKNYLETLARGKKLFSLKWQLYLNLCSLAMSSTKSLNSFFFFLEFLSLCQYISFSQGINYCKPFFGRYSEIATLEVQ